MMIWYILICLFRYSATFSYQEIPNGVFYYEDGIVIQSFQTEQHVITIQFPKYEQQLPNSVDSLNLPETTKQNVRKHLAIVGKKLNDHLKPKLAIWNKDISMTNHWL